LSYTSSQGHGQEQFTDDANIHLKRSVAHATNHRNMSKTNIRNLVQTSNRKHGLPIDVMKHQQKASVSMDTSIKFLQAASKNPELFKNVNAKQKRFR